jgi:hypothetical protein
MRARNIFVRREPPRHRRSVFTERRLGPLDLTVSRNRRHARTSTTALTDFCNRRKARAHWQTIATRRSAAFHGEALRLAALRRYETAPTARDSSQRRARHGSRLEYPTWTSQSPAPVPTHWRVTGCFRGQPRLTSRTPRERTISWKRARMPFAARDPSVSIRPGLAALGGPF